MLALVAKKRIRIAKIIKGRKLIILLNIIILLSNLYTINKKETLESSLMFTMVTIFALFLSAIYKEDKFVKLLSIYFILSIIFSVLMIGIFPSRGMMSDERFLAAKGIYGHKNILGRYMVIAFFFLISYARLSLKKRKKCIGYLFAIISVFLIFISKSNTAILYFIILSPIYMFIKNKKYLINTINKVVIIIACVFSIFVFLNSNPQYYNMFSKINIGERTLSMTGRNVIWNYSLEKINSAKYLGYGFDAVWSSNEIITPFINKYGFTIPHAHNGYLDTTLQLGIIGLIIMSLILLSLIKSRKVDKIILGSIFTWFLILINFTEAAFIEDTTYIFWILIVYFINSLNLDNERKVII